MNVLRLKQALLSPPTPTKWRRAMEGLDVTFGATGFEIRSAAPPEGDEYLNVTFGVTGFQLAHAVPPVAKEGISVAFGANEFIYKHHPYTSSREGVTVAFGATDLVFQHHPYTSSGETVNVTFGVNEFVYTGDPSFTTWSPLLMATAPYLVFDERSTVTPASGAISQWNDRSGSNRHMTQATGSYQPVTVDAVVGNKRVTRFTNDRLATTSGVDILNNQPSGWMFVAVKRTSTDASPTSRTIARINTNAAASTRMAFFSDDGANVNKLVFGNRRLDGEAYVGLSSTGTIGTSEWTLALGVTDYANRTIKLYLNSELNGTLTNQFTAGGNTSATNSSSIEIGNGSTNVEPFNGDIACVLAGRGIPTMQDIERLFGYYAQRYNLAAQLPANHSYKSRIPYPVSKTIDLRFDQTAGTTTFTDNAARLWTTSGTAAVSDTQKRIGSGSYYTAPGSVGYAKSSYTSYLNLSRDMFCIEAWVYPVGADAKSVNGCIISKRLTATDNDWVLQRDQVNNRIVFRFGDTSDSNRTLVSTNGSVPANTWTHIAVTRYRSTLTLYVNGNSAGTATIVGELLNRTTPVFLGGSGTTSDGSTLLSDGYWGGYLDNVQLTYGDFVYSSNFNPMDAVTSDTMNDGAPWSKVQLLLHFDGSDGSTTYTDSSLYARSMTALGGTSLSTAQSAFGGSSALMVNNSAFASTAIESRLQMRAGAFQIDFRMYPTSLPDEYNAIFGCTSATYGIPYEWLVFLRDDGIVFYHGTRGSNQSLLKFLFPGGLTSSSYLNLWTVVSVARDGSGQWGCWINGTRCTQYQYSPLQSGISYGSVVTGTYTNTVDLGDGFTGESLRVGMFTNDYNFVGYIDELRYIVGWSRDVTVSYTPLTVPFGFEIPTDPYQSNITAQFSGLNFAGTQSFLDDAGVAWTRMNTANISTAVAKWPGRRVLSFPSTTSTDHYSTTIKPVTPGQLFTLEAWVYVTGDGYSQSGGTPYLQPVFSETANTGSGDQFFGINDSRRIIFYRGTGIGNAETIVGSTTISKNTWHHLACTYDGTTIRLFVNGVLEASGDSAVGWVDVAGPFMLGRSYVPAWPTWSFGLQGYIGEYRITNGVCRYTSNFSVPQQPFDSLVGEVESDPYWESVVSLLHMDGSNGDTTFIDDTGNSWIASGDTKINVTQSKFGNSSAYFGGSYDYIRCTSNVIGFNQTDFTIEAWVYVNNLSTHFSVFDQRGNGLVDGVYLYIHSYYGVVLEMRSSNPSYTGGLDQGAGSGSSFPLTQWVHLAATRQGNTYRTFINGVNVSEGVFSSGSGYTFNNTQFNIGLPIDINGSYSSNGYIDEVRVTRGIARYTSNFAPPAQVFSDAISQSMRYFNPPDRHPNITIENSHRTATVLTGGAYVMARGAIPKSTGKWYAEFYIRTNNNDVVVGIENGTSTRVGYPGSTTTGYGYYYNGGYRYNATASGSPPSFTTGDTIGVAYDAVNAKVWFSKNGVWSGDPTAGTGQAFSSVVPRQRLAFGSSVVGASVTLRTRASDLQYTPPTGFYAWGGGTEPSLPVADPYMDNVITLLHFDGSNGSTTFLDERTRTWTAAGNAQLSTAQSVFGGSALTLDGSGDYIYTADAIEMRSSVSTYTIELFVRINTLAHIHTVYSKRSSPSYNSTESCLFIDTNGSVVLCTWDSGGTYRDHVSNATLSINTWYHIEIGCTGGVHYVFIDGVLSGTITVPGNAGGAPTTFKIGLDEYYTGARDFSGWIDEFKRTDGVIRHTANFTPPTEPSNVNVDAAIVSRLRFDGNHGLNRVYDAKRLPWTVGAGASISTTQFLTGHSALSLTGTSTSKLTTPSTPFDYSVDFTEEFTIRCNVVGGCVFNVDGLVGVHCGHELHFDGSGHFTFLLQRAGAWSNYSTVISTTVAVVDTWYRVKVTKSGLTLKMYVNGTLEATTVMPNQAIPPAGRTAYMGIYYDGASDGFNGYIDRFIHRSVADADGSDSDPPPTSGYVDRTYAEYVADVNLGTYARTNNVTGPYTDTLVLGLNRVNSSNMYFQLLTGQMWGSPRAANRSVTNDSSMYRVLQHGLQHLYAFRPSEANTIVIETDATTAPGFSAVSWNTYASTAYGSAYSAWRFVSFVYWDPLLERARKFNCVTTSYSDYYPGNPWTVSYVSNWTENNTGWNGYLCRQILAPSAAIAGSKIRIRIAGGGAGGATLVLTEAWIGIAVGARNYAFTTAPTRLTFNGSNGVSIAPYNHAVSDEIDFPLTGGERIMLSVHASAGDTCWDRGAIDCSLVYKVSAGGSEISQIAAPSGTTENTTASVFIAAVEVLAGGGVVNSGSDLFTVNSIADYTQYADTNVTWNIGSDTLSMSTPTSGNNQSVLTRNNVSFMNGSVATEFHTGADAGLVLRHIDTNNYYLAAIYDGSSSTGIQNRIRIYRRYRGVYTQLSDTTVTLTRGTPNRVVFSAQGSTLTLRVNGTLLSTVTDTYLPVAGKIGPKANFGPAVYNDLLWWYPPLPTVTSRYFRLWVPQRDNNGSGTTSGGYMNIRMLLLDADGNNVASNGAGGIVAGAACYQSSQYNSSYDAAAGFNGTSMWHTLYQDGPWWASIDFGSGVTKTVSKLVIMPQNTLPHERAPFEFALQTSTDGVNWTNVIYRTGLDIWALNVPVEFPID